MQPNTKSETTGQKLTDKRHKPLHFIELDTGCFVPISHRLNADGYFRKRFGSAQKNPNDIEMFHRTVFKMHHGDIPEGYEVDHMCNVRACCNPQHLRAMEGSEHASHSNRERARRKREEETTRH